jgi:hypothetical protein
MAAITAREACACSLYVGKTPVHTDALATCYSFVRDVAQRNLHNVRQSGEEVAGETSDAYASITCIARNGEQAIAVVSVVSSSNAAASALRDLLVNHIKGISRMD